MGAGECVVIAFVSGYDEKLYAASRGPHRNHGGLDDC